MLRQLRPPYFPPLLLQIWTEHFVVDRDLKEIVQSSRELDSMNLVD